MNLQKIKVYNLFWINAIIILVIGLPGINNSNNTLDVNVHDTYFIINHFHAAVVLFILFFLMGLGYWLIQKVCRKQLVKFLTIIHSTILIGSFILYWLVILFYKLFPEDTAFPLFDNYQLINVILVSELMLIIFIATPIYTINLLIGLFRKG